MFVMYRGLRLFPFVQVLPGFRVIHAKVQLLYSVNVCKCPYFPELYAIIIFRRERLLLCQDGGFHPVDSSAIAFEIAVPAPE